jgi:hypothetical protein
LREHPGLRRGRPPHRLRARSAAFHDRAREHEKVWPHARRSIVSWKWTPIPLDGDRRRHSHSAGRRLE